MSDSERYPLNKHITQKKARKYCKKYKNLKHEIHIFKIQNEKLNHQNILLRNKIKQLKKPFYIRIFEYTQKKLCCDYETF